MRAPLGALFLLCACSAPPAQPKAVICPGIESYSPAENRAIAGELAALPESDVLKKVADEDHRLRTELAACEASVTR